MPYDFDQLPDRLPFFSSKWNMNTRPYQRGDLLPLWVADSDFSAPDAVKEAIKAYAEHGLFGYAGNPPGLSRAIIGWLERQHNWKIEESWLSYPGSVVAALYAAVRALTAPGDKIILNNPVYPPFASAVRGPEREIVWNPLKLENDRYVMDFDHLRRLFTETDKKPSLLIFCSPHNAAGRVWEREELEALLEILEEFDCKIVTDEIHYDLVWDGKKHFTFGRLGEEALQRMIMVASASKSFNVAGLHASFAVVPNPEIRAKFMKAFEGVTMSNLIGKLALEACYTKSDDYLEYVKAYITKNLDFFIPAINERCAPIKTTRPEGTYLVWVDCRALGMEQKDLIRWFLEDLKIRVNDGATFGPGGEGFVRFNMAAPHFLFEEAVERLEAGVAKLQK